MQEGGVCTDHGFRRIFSQMVGNEALVGLAEAEMLGNEALVPFCMQEGGVCTTMDSDEFFPKC